ncbi:hypothetical protein SAMN05878482_107251 [Peribacillus simplex]|uniref:Uncharacterized protein n=1 Tax=Peribacillus simplex TaxID=1478 RepID=A0A9X8RD01_9BACI|nr:hypothetical protein SAMN05878482_107251 [Peribacillus simplex]
MKDRGYNKLGQYHHSSIVEWLIPGRFNRINVMDALLPGEPKSLVYIRKVSGGKRTYRHFVMKGEPSVILGFYLYIYI